MKCGLFLPVSLFSRPGRFLAFIWLLTALLFSGAGKLAAADPPKPGPAELKKILADFEQYAEQARKFWEVPGMAVAIVQGDQVIFAKGFGVKKVGGTEPVDEHTIFQIGSTSKAFTVALVAMLVDEKKVGWQDKVINHLPTFRMFDPWVTREFMVEDLMAQRSGLPGYAGDGQAFLGFDRAHLIQSLRYFKPVTSFRSQYAYQNGLFLVPAALVEKYTGKSWEENVQTRLFKPLGMSATSTGLTGFQQAKNVTFLHRKKEGQVTPLPRDWPYHYWVYIYGPAGGINSNIMDMTKWLRLQLGKGKFNGKQLISEANLEFLKTPKTILGEALGARCYYCQGWVYTAKTPYPLIWHTGGTSGNGTVVALVPEAGIGLVVLANLITGLPLELVLNFYDRYLGNPPRDWRQEIKTLEDKEKKAIKAFSPPAPPAAPAPALPLERYTGTYHHQVYGKAIVAAHQDSLLVTMGPKHMKLSLRPWDRDIFQFYFPPYWQDKGDSTDLSLAAFRIGPDGRAQSMTVNWEGGPEEFTRLEEKASP